MALRPYWSGTIRLSLVSLPVNIYAALNRSKQIAFHEIYRPTGERVHHVLKAGGKEIDREDVIKGYEVEKGEYVLVEPEEIQELKIPSSKTLEIVQFVNVDAVDEVYFESPYFVAPADGDDQTYAVIRDALRDSGKVGIGQLAIGGRERLCSLKPFGSGMLIETLRYEDEIKDTDPYFEQLEDLRGRDEEVDLALELIKRKSRKFNPGEFKDHYRLALKELIDAKVEHRAPEPVVEEAPAPKVVNLMDALRQSLRAQEADKPAARRTRTEAKTKKRASAKTAKKAKTRKAS